MLPQVLPDKRSLVFGCDVVFEMLLQSIGHELRDAQRPLACFALLVGVVAGVGVQLTSHVQSRTAVIMPPDITPLQPQAFSTAQLAPGRELPCLPTDPEPLYTVPPPVSV